MINSTINTKAMTDLLDSYEYDSEGNPRMIEDAEGKLYSYQEAEAAGLLESEPEEDEE